MIAQGIYLARAISAAMGESGTKKTPGVTVTFRIEQEGPHKGEMIDWTGWMTEKTRDRTADSLELCGFDGEDFATVVKNAVNLVIEHEEYETDNAPGVKKKRARVQWVNDPNRAGSGLGAMDAATEQSVKADLRGLVLARKAAKGQTAAPAATAPVGPPPKF